MSGVDVVSKYMDEKVDVFCDSIIELFHTRTQFAVIKTDEERLEFINQVKDKFNVFFEGNIIRISKPKLESNKRPTTGYMIYVKENRNQVKEQYGLTDFGQIGKKMSELWNGFDKEVKNTYNQKAKDYDAAKVEKQKETKVVTEVKEKKVEKIVTELKQVEEKVVTEVKEKKQKKVKDATEVKEKKQKKDATEVKEKKQKAKPQIIENSKVVESKVVETTKVETEKKETDYVNFDSLEDETTTPKQGWDKKLIRNNEGKLRIQTSKCDETYFTDNEPLSIDDEYWTDKTKHVVLNEKKNIFYHQDCKIAFTIDQVDGDYIFEGVYSDNKLIQYKKNCNIPETIIQWVRDCELIIKAI